MKTINITLTLLITVLATACLPSCMQWHDTEGPWFGSWHIESLYINGEPDESYNADPNIMISFEANIFDMGFLDGDEIYGTWNYAGEMLTLNASYKAGTWYNPQFKPFPVALHFLEGVEMVEISVTSLQNKTMQWQYIDQNDDLITYNLRKYP